MSPLEYKLFHERNLPHYQPPGTTLFITFRLAGSLPHEAMLQLETESRQLEADVARRADESARKQAAITAQAQQFGRWDAELDSGEHGPQWLATPAVAEMVCEAMHYRDGKEYILEAYCVMPNHVHLVCTPISDERGVYPLSKIMQSLKGYTARKANLLLGRSGDFWQHESYDHVVRDAEELERIVAYVLNNPVKAGLSSDWVYSRYQK